MVDPAGVVALVITVDDFARTQHKEKRVKRIIGVGRVTPIGFFIGNPRTGVLDDAGASGYLASRKHAPTMNGRLSHDVPRRTFCRVIDITPGLLMTHVSPQNNAGFPERHLRELHRRSVEPLF